jgi:hypothetical protein
MLDPAKVSGFYHQVVRTPHGSSRPLPIAQATL